jgi:lysophosphatidylcholine acyltransferase/lyso-PAF acetyltransferase
MEVRVLPPYVPSEAEKHNPELYADNVRRAMATALGDVHCTNHAFEDVAMLMQVGDYATRHVVPLTDVGEIATLTSLRGADVSKLVTYFSRHDLDKDGLLSLEELQHLLPADDPALVEQLFFLVDVDGSGQIDFRELCLALKSLNPSFSDDDLARFAFRLYDLDDNGVIDGAELERMMSFIQSFYGVSVPDALETAIAEMTHGSEHCAISFEQFQQLVEKSPEVLGHTRSRLELLRGSLRVD